NYIRLKRTTTKIAFTADSTVQSQTQGYRAKIETSLASMTTDGNPAAVDYINCQPRLN
ncbi:MAG: hypothetical protein ACI915_001859, partial [Gammaproteobacteria bacterium]